MGDRITKNVISINLGNYGSTGSIVYGIESISLSKKFKYCCAYPQKKDNKEKRENDYHICSEIFCKINHRLAYHSGLLGCFAVFSTLRLLWKIDRLNPDIIHIHNIHGDFLNIPLLFYYTKRKDIKIVWTLHDCWAFTGRCPYFMMLHCNKWKTGCFACEYAKQSYPESMIDLSNIMWKMKKNCFTGIKKMIVITPSEWLAGIVRDSFFKEYPIKVINNGIDLSIFKIVESDFRKKYEIAEERYIVLGVSFGWSIRKGIDIFMKLAAILGEKYQIVLVGTDEYIEKSLPNNIILIRKTKSQYELAQIYSAANVFVNPTREDNFPTVNMEALACGTPVITFNTGGSPECIDNTCGIVVENENMDVLEKAINDVCERNIFSQEKCRERAQKFNANDKYEAYIEIYKGMIED